MGTHAITRELNSKADKKKAKTYQWFFKTGKGEYGEGDVFIGLTVPKQRVIAKKYSHLPLVDLKKLLQNKIHEYRLTALLILVAQYQKADNKGKKTIVDFYLNNTNHINNWDLVDLSAHKILGDYLQEKEKRILYKLAKSKNLWERRISVVSTFALINKNQFTDSIKLAQIHLADQHDLMHKAVGWMLREIGKKDQALLEKFLKKNVKTMPRTMLRYAIEKFDEKKRKLYLTL